MKYAFRWRERAVRQLRAIPQPAALTILRALTLLESRGGPTQTSEKLAGYADRYRLRVGDYRVIYEITGEQLIILVVGVGHRREAYRALSVSNANAGIVPTRAGKKAGRPSAMPNR